MRFLEHPGLSRISALLKDLDVGDRILSGRLELFSLFEAGIEPAQCPKIPAASLFIKNEVDSPSVTGSDDGSSSGRRGPAGIDAGTAPALTPKIESAESQSGSFETSKVEVVGRVVCRQTGAAPDLADVLKNSLVVDGPVPKDSVADEAANKTFILENTSAAIAEGTAALPAVQLAGPSGLAADRRRLSIPHVTAAGGAGANRLDVSPIHSDTNSVKDSSTTAELHQDGSPKDPFPTGPHAVPNVPNPLLKVESPVVSEPACSPHPARRSASLAPGPPNSPGPASPRPAPPAAQRRSVSELEIPSLEHRKRGRRASDASTCCSGSFHRNGLSAPAPPDKPRSSKRRRSSSASSSSCGLLGTQTLGEAKKLLIQLVTTLNACFPDYDFSSVSPKAFQHVEDFVSVYSTINYHLSFLAERVVPGFLQDFWMAVRDAVDLKRVSIYSYTNAEGAIESDPFQDEDACLFAFDYFFVDGKGGRILFVSCMTKKKDLEPWDSSDEQQTGGDLSEEEMLSGASVGSEELSEGEELMDGEIRIR